MKSASILLALILLVLPGCVADPVKSADAPAEDWHSETRWTMVAQKIGHGTFKNGVYTIVLPRKDQVVNHIDFGDIPLEAGLESRLHFFACECGKTMIAGELCLVDYELNDVLDELRAGNMKVTGIAPMFIGSKPNMLAVRIQGEGADEVLIPALRKALYWMGEKQFGPQQ
jgi:hypothetical protein